MANPELHIGKIPISMSVAGIVEKDGRILLVRASDGYGPPAGHVEGYEFYRPDTTLFYELIEEANVYPDFGMSLWGLMLSLGKDKVSLGLVYKVKHFRYEEKRLGPIMDEEVTSAGFIDKERVRELLSSGQVRKVEWNRPLLEGWLNKKKFLFKVRWNRE